VAPSVRFSMAASVEAMRLSMGEILVAAEKGVHAEACATAAEE
jgi:hypothetical protein